MIYTWEESLLIRLNDNGFDRFPKTVFLTARKAVQQSISCLFNSEIQVWHTKPTRGYRRLRRRKLLQSNSLKKKKKFENRWCTVSTTQTGMALLDRSTHSLLTLKPTSRQKMHIWSLQMYNLSAIHNTYRSTTGESPKTYDDTLQRTIKSNTSFRLNCPWPRFFTVGSFEHWPEAPGTRNAALTNLARGKEKLSIVPEDFPVFPLYKRASSK